MEHMTVNTDQAKELLIDCVKAGLVPMLAGSPGVGKSSIINQVAETYDLKVIDLRLSQCDPTDLNGFPSVDKDKNKASYIPMDTFPLATDELPLKEGTTDQRYSGWLLFLDEFTSAPIAVQAAAYKVVLDKAVGQHKLHKNCAIICAGNKTTDGAIVSRMSTAMQSRLIHLELEMDHTTWLNWAASNNIDHRITSYINFKPGMLNDFSPDHSDHTFACGRTWEFVSKLISDWSTIDNSKKPLLAGTVGEGAAREFMAFCGIYKDLPTIQQIISNPTATKVPTEASTQYAISGSIANHANEQNIESLIKFIDRLPMEFQVITIQEMYKRKKDLITSRPLQEWTTRNAKELF